MIFLMRLLFSFVGFIFFLSITINQKPIFHYIYQNISPLTISIQKTTQDFLTKSFSGAKKFTKNIFRNSAPELAAFPDGTTSWKKIKDSVHFKSSSFENIRPGDLEYFNDHSGPENSMEDITFSEKEELSRLIQKN